jgi:MFS family permease
MKKPSKTTFNKAIKILIVTNGLVLIAGAMLGPIYALFVEKIGGSLLQASYAYGIYAITAAIANLISGKYIDKIKKDDIAMVVVIGYTIMGFAFFGYIFVNSIWTLFLVQAIIGIGEAIYSPAFDTLYSEHLDKSEFGEEWGALEAIKYLTLAIGAIIGGLLVTSFGFNAIFVLMGLLCLVSGIYIFRLPRKIL